MLLILSHNINYTNSYLIIIIVRMVTTATILKSIAIDGSKEKIIIHILYYT